jgi:phenylpropionate dioxygenase-like ring-hydroxylating dioxygenase large terminal subunit
MLSQADNDTLTQVGPGTTMGELMRQYWIPAITSSEVEGPDCDPVRIRLLGEDLIAFRDSNGTVGIMDNYCPHRRASMFFGRNEECGLRCVYHGWKFDVNGDCVDMPSEPLESNFKDKVKIKAYGCRERNGIVWTYMGPRETPPELSSLEANMRPDRDYTVSNILRNCNWMQALEGDIDTAHLGFLHLGSADPKALVPGSTDYYTVNVRHPKYNVMDTDYGVTYAAYRPAEANSTYWRFANYLLPFYTQIPTGKLGLMVRFRAWVPIDDTHTMFWSVTATAPEVQGGGRRTDANGKLVGGSAGQTEYLPNTTGWLGRWNLAADAANDYKIDRDAQKKNEIYTGITGIFLQDQAVTESMGPIDDRTKERLGTSDSMIIKSRRRALNAARALQEGITPPGVDNPEVFSVRTGDVILPNDVDWLEGTSHLREAFVEHPELMPTQKA